MVLGNRGWPDGGTGCICLAALFLSAAGSAIVNGVLDASMDLRMERLRKRSAALEVVGRRRALITAISGIAAALCISLRFLGPLAFLLILAAVLSYTLLYTLRLKRRSPWGAVPGGIPGALPVLIGYAAVAGTIRPDAIILFIFMILWQPPHFWSLALAYRDDYERGGVPVLPVARGTGFTRVLILVYATALIPASVSLWLFGYCSILYGAFALALGIAFLTACAILFKDTGRSRTVFSASIFYLILIFTAIVVDVCLVGGRPT
jgi:heme o synthase